MERNDISVQVDEYLLNYRVSAIIRKGSKILTHHSIGSEHYTLPGGRVKEGEDTISALQREILEEMNLKTKYIRPVSFIENFFILKGKKYHELLVTHELEFEDKNAYNIDIKPAEAHKKGKLEFKWIDTKELDNIKFVPKEMKRVIEGNKTFEHIINNENKEQK